MTICPDCKRKNVVTEIRILNVTKLGVAFKCPIHGICGFRKEHMTDEDKQCFGNELNRLGIRCEEETEEMSEDEIDELDKRIEDHFNKQEGLGNA